MKINRHKLNLLAGFCLLLTITLACDCEHSQEIKGPGGIIYSTANISRLKLGLDQDTADSRNVFQPSNRIYAVAKIENANNGSLYTLQFRLRSDKVMGYEAGHIFLENKAEETGSGNLWFEFHNNNGFPQGSYRAEVILLDDKEKTVIDRKEVSFSIINN